VQYLVLHTVLFDIVPTLYYADWVYSMTFVVQEVREIAVRVVFNVYTFVLFFDTQFIDVVN